MYRRVYAVLTGHSSPVLLKAAKSLLLGRSFTDAVRFADCGGQDSTHQQHRLRPHRGRQSCWTLPEVPILSQFQKFLFWISLFFVWGSAIADVCHGTAEIQTIHPFKRRFPPHQSMAGRPYLPSGNGSSQIYACAEQSSTMSRGCWVCSLTLAACAPHLFADPVERGIVA